MAGFGQASSSFGKDGQGGSAGAFNDNLGLMTGKTWYGNAAFGKPGGMATGFASGTNGNYSNYRNPDGSPMNMGPAAGNVNRGLAALPKPQPVMQPVIQPTAMPIPRPVQPLGYSWYDALRASFPPGNDFGSFNPVNGSTHYKNNQGMPANYNWGTTGGSTHYKGV